MMVQLPIALEIPASSTFVVRLGGRFTVSDVRFSEAIRPVGATPTLGTLGDGVVQSGVELAAGFRYDIADVFSLDLAILGSDQPEQRAALDLRQVFTSGVFHL